MEIEEKGDNRSTLAAMLEKLYREKKQSEKPQDMHKDQFNLMQWLAELIIGVKRPDEGLKIIEGCIELMSNSDLGEDLTPYILQKYLNATENCAENIAAVINRILEKGHHNHKLIISRTLIILENWFSKVLKEEKYPNNDPK